MNYVITYDIEDNKNRKKLSDLLEGFGFRVNYSVFECELTKTTLKRLVKTIKEENYINIKTDSLRFYHICNNCIPKSFEVSNREEIFEKKELFI